MIHPSAFVHPSAKVHESVSVGKGTHVYDGAILGAPPQDLKYAGEDTRLEIGENCTIREYCTLNRGTVQGGGVTRLADKVLLMTYSHVGHDCLIEEGAVISNGCQLGGHARIGRYATLGGNVGMPQRNQVGAFAFVGATLKVEKDVPPASKAFGIPLKWGGLNLHALKLHSNEFSEERIAGLDKAFRTLYRSGRPIQEVIDELKASGDPLFREFFDEHWGGTLIRP